MINDTKLLFYNYLHLLIGKAVVFGMIGFATTLLLVRIMQPVAYGSFVLFGSVASIISILTIWTSASIVRFGREEFIAEGSIKKTFWANYWILLPAFVLCFILVCVLGAKLGQYIGISWNVRFLLLSYIIFSNLILNIPVAFQAIGKMKYFSYLPLVFSGGFFVVLLAIYFLHISVSIEWVIGYLIIGHLITAVIGLWLLRKYIIPWVFSMEWIKKCLSYSWPVVFGGMSSMVVQNIDQLVIGLFMAISFVGIYNVAYLFQTYLIVVPMLSVSLMFPLMVSLVAVNRKDSITNYVKDYAPQIAFFWSLIIVVFLVFAREIVMLFGVAYVVAAMPLMVLLLGMAFRIFPIIESPVISSRDLIKQATVVNVGLGLIDLGLDFLLIPRIGIVGAAIASTSAFIFSALGFSFILKKWLGINDYRNYHWLFPAVVGFAGAMLITGLIYRVVFLVAVVTVSLMIAKKSTVFNSKTLVILDSIDMPASVRQTMKQVYSVLI